MLTVTYSFSSSTETSMLCYAKKLMVKARIKKLKYTSAAAPLASHLCQNSLQKLSISVTNAIQSILVLTHPTRPLPQVPLHYQNWLHACHTLVTTWSALLNWIPTTIRITYKPAFSVPIWLTLFLLLCGLTPLFSWSDHPTLSPFAGLLDTENKVKITNRNINSEIHKYGSRIVPLGLWAWEPWEQNRYPCKENRSVSRFTFKPKLH